MKKGKFLYFLGFLLIIFNYNSILKAQAYTFINNPTPNIEIDKSEYNIYENISISAAWNIYSNDPMFKIEILILNQHPDQFDYLYQIYEASECLISCPLVNGSTYHSIQINLSKIISANHVIYEFYWVTLLFSDDSINLKVFKQFQLSATTDEFVEQKSDQRNQTELELENYKPGNNSSYILEIIIGFSIITGVFLIKTQIKKKNQSVSLKTIKI